MAYFTTLGNVDSNHQQQLASRVGKPKGVYWTVSQHADVGDIVLFYITAPTSAVVAKGIVRSKPIPKSHERYKKKHWADIDQIMMLESPLKIRFLKEKFPQWGWLRNPMVSCEIPAEIHRELDELIGGR